MVSRLCPSVVRGLSRSLSRRAAGDLPSLPPPRIGCRGYSSTARRGAAAARRGRESSPGDPPKIDSTVFFRMTNPELFLDVKSARTWGLVAFVWVAFGGSYLYLRYEEGLEEEAERKRQALLNGPTPTGIGPAPRPPSAPQ